MGSQSSVMQIANVTRFINVEMHVTINNECIFRDSIVRERERRCVHAKGRK